MLKVNQEYGIKDDIEFVMEAEKITASEFSDKTGISRTTIDEILNTGRTTDKVLEKFYAYVYSNNYRINSVKEELIKEAHHNVLFHGSKRGLTEVTISNARENCDFGKGFYLGEAYSQALSFICEYEKSSVYSFKYSLDGLNVVRFDCSMEWMLAICYFRGTLGAYSHNETVEKIISKIESADVVIAPIADNKMFYIMAQFTDGDINADVALHSLSASSLGLQYVFRTEKSLKCLIPIDKYYICGPEREDCRRLINERGYEIDTKLKLSKREYKTGLFIEELLK